MAATASSDSERGKTLRRRDSHSSKSDGSQARGGLVNRLGKWRGPCLILPTPEDICRRDGWPTPDLVSRGEAVFDCSGSTALLRVVRGTGCGMMASRISCSRDNLDDLPQSRRENLSTQFNIGRGRGLSDIRRKRSLRAEGATD